MFFNTFVYLGTIYSVHLWQKHFFFVLPYILFITFRSANYFFAWFDSVHFAIFSTLGKKKNGRTRTVGRLFNIFACIFVIFPSIRASAKEHELDAFTISKLSIGISQLSISTSLDCEA